MRISYLGGSSAEDRTGALEAGAGQGRGSKLAGSHPLKRILLFRKVFRYLLSEELITLRPNQLVGLLGEVGRSQVLQLPDHLLWNNLSILVCLTLECNN